VVDFAAVKAEMLVHVVARSIYKNVTIIDKKTIYSLVDVVLLVADALMFVVVAAVVVVVVNPKV